MQLNLLITSLSQKSSAPCSFLGAGGAKYSAAGCLLIYLRFLFWFSGVHLLKTRENYDGRRNDTEDGE